MSFTGSLDLIGHVNLRSASRFAFALAVVSCAHRSPLDRRIDDLLQRARAHEPAVTAQLQALATEHGATLIKLEYRLKTRESMTRKLNKMALSQPELHPSTLEPGDALRYTMRIDDEPAGHYLEVVRTVLADIESHQHQVAQLKNYWPRDDSYSGLNAVLIARDGTHWELQFHTTASLAVQAATRSQYERLRETSTPLDVKRRLFDEMAKSWAAVPVPAGLLAAERIHPASERKTIARP